MISIFLKRGRNRSSLQQLGIFGTGIKPLPQLRATSIFIKWLKILFYTAWTSAQNNVVLCIMAAWELTMKKWKLIKPVLWLNTLQSLGMITKQHCSQRNTVWNETHCGTVSHTNLFICCSGKRNLVMFYVTIPNNANQSSASSFMIYILKADWLWSTKKNEPWNTNWLNDVLWSRPKEKSCVKRSRATVQRNVCHNQLAEKVKFAINNSK